MRDGVVEDVAEVDVEERAVFAYNDRYAIIAFRSLLTTRSFQVRFGKDEAQVTWLSPETVSFVQSPDTVSTILKHQL